MKIQKLLFTFPVVILALATSAIAQTTILSNAVVDDKTITQSHWNQPADTSASYILPDSLTASLHNGWYKAPLQMPILITGLLPNSMSIITPPEVDQKMIIPMTQASIDSTVTPKRKEP